jgi:hypothetical protein
MPRLELILLNLTNADGCDGRQRNPGEAHSPPDGAIRRVLSQLILGKCRIRYIQLRPYRCWPLRGPRYLLTNAGSHQRTIFKGAKRQR